MEYTIILTEACNMECSYCYQGEDKIKSFMSSDTVEKIADFMLRKNSGNISIGFLGGEPLLNFKAIQQFVQYFEKKALKRKIKYGITTNAILLNDTIISFMKEHNFSIRISIDGDQYSHDLNRKCQIENSYNIITENIRKLFSEGMLAAARMTVTHNNLPLLSRNIKYLYEIGFRGMCIGLDYSTEYSEEYIKLYKQQMEEIERFYITKLKTGEKFEIDVIDGKLLNLAIKKDAGGSLCGAGRCHFVFKPDGTIYPCSFVMGKKDFCYGNTQSQFNEEEKYDELVMKNVWRAENKCYDCKISGFCHGMKCGYVNYLNTGYLNIPNKIMCETEKILYQVNLRVLSEIVIHNQKTLQSIIGYIEENQLKMSQDFITALNRKELVL